MSLGIAIYSGIGLPISIAYQQGILSIDGDYQHLGDSQ
jgi:hypothetical protein